MRNKEYWYDVWWLMQVMRMNAGGLGLAGWQYYDRWRKFHGD